MKTQEEKEHQEDRFRYEEFAEIFRQLTPWNQFLVINRFRWLLFKQRIQAIPVSWLRFQLNLEDDMRDLGMPRQLKWQLVKWFNFQPFSDVTEYFMCKGKKIWHSYFLEEDNFEFHLHYKHKFTGMVWLELKDDGVADIIGIDVCEDLRNAGLGTTMFQESVKLIKDKVTCIKGVLEKEYYPEPVASLRWLRRQGFEVIQRQNGDYQVELWINKEPTEKLHP